MGAEERIEELSDGGSKLTVAESQKHSRRMGHWAVSRLAMGRTGGRVPWLGAKGACPLKMPPESQSGCSLESGRRGRAPSVGKNNSLTLPAEGCPHE